MERLIAWGPWGLALAAFSAGSVVPVPSEGVLAALVVLGRGAVAMTALATVCNVAGAATLFAAGRAGRRLPAVQGTWFERAERLFSRFGAALLLLSGLPLVGDPIVVIAGAAGVPWPAALALIAAGKGIRYSIVAAGAVALRARL